MSHYIFGTLEEWQEFNDCEFKEGDTFEITRPIFLDDELFLAANEYEITSKNDNDDGGKFIDIVEPKFRPSKERINEISEQCAERLLKDDMPINTFEIIEVKK